MAESVIVGIADYKLVRRPDRLITYALGSCVGIALYDPTSGIGGLAHIMLPDSSLIRSDTNPKKFANTAIPQMLNDMIALGAHKFRMIARIAGGAMLFGQTDTMRIGQRNVEETKFQLQRLGLRLVAEETGSNFGRTMELHTETGIVLIKTALHGSHELI